MTERELSHLLQMRGLKPKRADRLQHPHGRIFYRCVDWNNLEGETPEETDSRIFYRCVDWNTTSVEKAMEAQSRIFYRCVDWNFERMEESRQALSRIFYRCVDWNQTGVNIIKATRMSHLLQMRGLKQVLSFFSFSFSLSHLLQMRGLKRLTDAQKTQVERRIFYRCVDWNQRVRKGTLKNDVASFTDAWIETISDFWKVATKESHLLQMRGLKRRVSKRIWRNESRIFYRCVDWNKRYAFTVFVSLVASFTDAWIETRI